RAARERRDLLGREHAARLALERDDAFDRARAAAAAPVGSRAVKPKIGIFGAGWVGLVTGACFAELGHEVVVRDVVPQRIESLERGEVPFFEDDVQELIARNRDRLVFTLDVADLTECEFLFVCVDTPPTQSGDA